MKILLSGYYGFDNAGDEFILESIIADIRRHEPTADITVLSSQPAKTARLHGVRAVDRWNWLSNMREIRACDTLISGGGGLFQDDTGNLSLYYYLAIIALARLFGKRILLYGVGINVLKRFNQWLTVLVFNGVEHITVREEESFRLLSSWGCDVSKMELVADPVLLKNVGHVDREKKVVRLAFILRPPRGDAWSVDTFAKLADSLAQRLNASVVFVPFHGHYDMQFTLSVMNAMNSSSRLIQWTDFRELYAVIAESDFVISQRLHGLILAALYGIPMVGISDDAKIQRFMKEMGQKNITGSAAMSHFALLAVILDMWEWREDFRENARVALAAAQTRARRLPDLLFRKQSDDNSSLQKIKRA